MELPHIKKKKRATKYLYIFPIYLCNKDARSSTIHQFPCIAETIVCCIPSPCDLVQEHWGTRMFSVSDGQTIKFSSWNISPSYHLIIYAKDVFVFCLLHSGCIQHPTVSVVSVLRISLKLVGGHDDDAWNVSHVSWNVTAAWLMALTQTTWIWFDYTAIVIIAKCRRVKKGEYANESISHWLRILEPVWLVIST